MPKTRISWDLQITALGLRDAETVRQRAVYRIPGERWLEPFAQPLRRQYRRAHPMRSRGHSAGSRRDVRID